MSDFKSMVKADIKNVFINTNEFADMHTINGKEMPAVMDENELLKRQLKSNLTAGAGIYKRTTLLYVAASDYGNLPAIGREVTVDGRTFRVTHSLSEGGMYSIHLEAMKN